MSKKNRIRLYINAELYEGQQISCDEKQIHYLLNVMRSNVGDEVFVFNGKDGEFCATVEEICKKKCILSTKSKFAEFKNVPDVWLLFSPLKKDNTDIVIQKATELGVRKIVPVLTEYTSNMNVKIERLKMQVIEASEQCRRQDIPEVQQCTDLQKLLLNWNKNRSLIYLDESLKSESAKEQMVKHKEPVAILVGPEGGFSEKELEILRKLDYTCGVSLGDRILRAETAVIAALSCWQAFSGDWQ